MHLHYETPRDIFTELDEMMDTKYFDQGGNALKIVVLNDREMKFLKDYFKKIIDKKSREASPGNIQCHRHDYEDDVYSGGYSYYEWTGEWRAQDKEGKFLGFVKIMSEAEWEKHKSVDFSSKKYENS